MTQFPIAPTPEIPILDYPTLAMHTALFAITAACVVVLLIALDRRASRVLDARGAKARALYPKRIGDVGPCALCGNVRVWDGRTVAAVQCDRSEVAKPVCASCAAATHQLGRVA